MVSSDRLPLFGPFSVDTSRGCLLREDEVVHLRPQAYHLLIWLAENRGRLISKDELIDRVWQGRAVTDDSLVQCLRDIRQALAPEGARYVRNVRGRGYIFDAVPEAAAVPPPVAPVAGYRGSWVLGGLLALGIVLAIGTVAYRHGQPVALSPGDGPRVTGYSPDSDAELLYRRGRYYQLKVTEPDLRQAIGLYERAIAIDAKHARSLAALAEAHRVLAVIGHARSADVFPVARAAATRALELDGNLAEAHIALGWIHFSYEWDWTAAEESFKRALAIEPKNPDALRGYAHLLSNEGRHEEATFVMARARELDPASLLNRGLEAQFLFYAGRYDDCEARVRDMLELDPDNWLGYLQLGRVRILRGQPAAAIEAFDKAVARSNRSVEALTQLGYALGVAGQVDAARKVLTELEAKAATAPVPAYSLAMIANGLRNREAAMSQLERSVEARELQATFIKVDTRWNWLRADPRFDALLSRVRLK